MKKQMWLGAALIALSIVRAEADARPAPTGPLVLDPARFQQSVETFNRDDEELYAQYVPNAAAWEFLRANVPLFDCPDPDINQVFAFRWWTYRKHIKETPDGFVITEFLPPVPWAGKHNTINCSAMHHFREGRWLRDRKFLDDYSVFWLRKGGAVRSYSFPIADALLARAKATGDTRLAIDLLPDLVRNYEAWEKDHRDANGLYWQTDDRDGGEVSIGGNGDRASINSYQYADALAIAELAQLAGKSDLSSQFTAKAEEIKRLVSTQLWDGDAQFFKVRPRGEGTKLVDVRELHGYTPWYVGLAGPEHASAWAQLMDSQGFFAPFGPTTAERRHPGFKISYEGHECQWNGPSWPFATSITLTALANFLNGPPQTIISKADYMKQLEIYAKSQHRTRKDGKVVPWIDEDLSPDTGDWIARTLLKQRGETIKERGKDYNHSTFCDLVITGLVGLRPRLDDTLEVNPLVPEGAWDYFCLDAVPYHGRSVTVLYDKTGGLYHKGRGLRVFVDGGEVASSEKLERLVVALPPKDQGIAGWVKYPGNPVMGGKYGTCFDISVLKEGDTYRMWLSWRPKASVALVESPDGIHWSEPPRIVLGPRKETGWEDDINRPVVVKRNGTYHMWYTGQAKGHSGIGYATSPNGTDWARQSDKPVLTAEQPWEKVAVMCPHVLWDEKSHQYRMWYSGGDQYEPDAIGHATSADGLVWKKDAANPVFRPDPNSQWEKHKVAAVQVIKRPNDYLMFYIGYRDVDHAQIGLARSPDGLTGWVRHPANPIVRPTPNGWDHDACYKPFAICAGAKWLLWYNGRHGGLEQIGVVVHDGADIGF